MPSNTAVDQDVSPRFHVVQDLFVIPDGDRYLLYAPLSKGVLAVNRAAVAFLQQIKQGVDAGFDHNDPFVKQLLEAGVLVTAADAHRRVRFPAKTGEFDPKGLGLFLTTRCSMACSYCYADGGSSGKVMDWDVAKTAMDWMMRHTKQSGRREFYLIFHGGGEVTSVKSLFKRCVDYARDQARRQDLEVRIDAGLNGVMSEELTDWVVTHLNGATVSLDGLPEIHNANRPLCGGKSSFDVVARTLRRMDEKGFSYGIRATVTPDAVAHLPASVEYICRHFAVKNIQAEPVFAVGRAVNMVNKVNPQYFVDRFREAEAVARRYGRILKYSGARFHNLTNRFCKVSDDSLSVTSDGLLTSCFEVAEGDDDRSATFCYGNVNVANADIDIDMDKLRNLRTLTVEHKPHCENCFCKWHCAGDCAAKQAMGGDPWDPSDSPRCHINRELTKDQMRAYLEYGPGTLRRV